jgi:hypothetical protein
MRRRLAGKLTRTHALVLIVGLLLSVAWAVPSLGANVGKVARLALGRANEAFHNANLAIDASNKAKDTANGANSAASSAKSAADSAQSSANAAQSTANTALAATSGTAHVQSNFTRTFDPGSIAQTSCTASPFSQSGVLPSDEVIVTPPDTQPVGIMTQAFTSSNEVTLVFCNVAGGGPIDPPSGSYEFSILR